MFHDEDRKKNIMSFGSGEEDNESLKDKVSEVLLHWRSIKSLDWGKLLGLVNWATNGEMHTGEGVLGELWQRAQYSQGIQ